MIYVTVKYTRYLALFDSDVTKVVYEEQEGKVGSS